MAKNKSLFISIFLTLVIALSNFTDAMEGQKPEISETPSLYDLANLCAKQSKIFNIIPQLGWHFCISFPNDKDVRDLYDSFNKSHEEFGSKFVGLPLNFVKFRFDKLPDNTISPTIQIVMQYVVKFDTTNKAIKCYWKHQGFYNKAESISQEDEGFKQFKVKLHNVVKDVEELLGPKLSFFTNIIDQMAYLVANLKDDKEILLYNVVMDLCFDMKPVEE